MAEVEFSDSPDDILIALGLGSCICVCAYDPHARLAAMVNIVLPESHDDKAVLAKFADTAIPMLVSSIVGRGGAPERLRIALAGGADLAVVKGNGVRLEMGKRNVQAVQWALEQANLTVSASDLGGSAGRTVHFLGDGQVRVKVIGRPELRLADLGQ